jgi:hypothetical protein
MLPVSLLGLLYTLHSYRPRYGEPFGFARARTFLGESAIPINNPHGCSSSSQKMQYAVQIDCIWCDLFQSLEETRDAMSSNSVQVGNEMSPEFACAVT